MASRNATNTKSLVINPLVPITDEEKQIYAGGEGSFYALFNYKIAYH